MQPVEDPTFFYFSCFTPDKGRFSFFFYNKDNLKDVIDADEGGFEPPTSLQLFRFPRPVLPGFAI